MTSHNLQTLPYETKEINGFTIKKSQELRESILEAKKNKKSFSSSKKLIRDALL